jgi:hypothetical protein
MIIFSAACVENVRRRRDELSPCSVLRGASSQNATSDPRFVKAIFDSFSKVPLVLRAIFVVTLAHFPGDPLGGLLPVLPVGRVPDTEAPRVHGKYLLPGRGESGGVYSAAAYRRTGSGQLVSPGGRIPQRVRFQAELARLFTHHCAAGREFEQLTQIVIVFFTH